MTADASLESLLTHIADKPVTMARLACVLLAKGRGAHARELCARAVALDPENGEVHALAAEVLSHDVPAWHFRLLQDSVRHKLYERALRRAIRPGSRVLDIGTGTGLFAMMAARAGAAEVVTCEANPTIAAVAAEIIAHNGLADRVFVVAKPSSDLDIGIDLDGPADVLVWDNLAQNLIGAGALPTVEQAVRRLVRPGAQVIPAKGMVRIALAEDRKSPRELMSVVEGFDLSPFNRLAAPCYTISSGKERALLRSDSRDLFCFDFRSGGPFPEARSAVTVSASGGRVNGIAQWYRLEIDEEERYENIAGGGQASALGSQFYSLTRPIELSPGDTFTIYGTHDRRSVRIWADIREDRS
jgi:protein arginine N-methyltransferase 7